ncbi:hypothetical protein [Mesorhizobium sp. 131-2-1]|uniref:hypothetical protein n=1 Tax=Mesorhizobium sp. 131-2-1 TaxID=2744518 RepID=UPI00192971AD|nr:hypothetical protein [Mesorhizobium sp. 131-2-1]BCG91425.1 hypothetical protein MesoLj131a_02890 [Mesorhizobium sp. 131-2-1]
MTPVFEWLDTFSEEVVNGFARRPDPDSSISKALFMDRMAQARNEDEGPTLETIFCYLAASHGLHAAAEKARGLNDHEWAQELHELGQIYANYAVGDLGKVVDKSLALSAAAEATDGTVH